MAKVYVISICMGKKNGFNLFHFYGHYMGKRIQNIYIKDGDYSKNAVYLIHLEVLKVEKFILKGRALRSKLLINQL